MNAWQQAADVGAILCLLVGAGLCLVAGIGLLTLPDVLSRLHAATKPQSLGLLLVLLGVALRLRNPVDLGTLALVAFFQMTTTPIAALMVGRAAYRTGQVGPADLLRDELDEQLSGPRT
ncbi:monovalent cation/H(+) antiporter subunit G [Streptomyces sp. TP-A0874]|uniref:monovalent cation/H(+) antiporter subunit G n=1 Tax=Streptomyces sp. TP-A0874 TaxID=549819 RepID=UPI000853841A|nr:monovalent cation/H(+) antiporter subunit G [Streptomyces sp. TP-A0874]